MLWGEILGAVIEMFIRFCIWAGGWGGGIVLVFPFGMIMMWGFCLEGGKVLVVENMRWWNNNFHRLSILLENYEIWSYNSWFLFLLFYTFPRLGGQERIKYFGWQLNVVIQSLKLCKSFKFWGLFFLLEENS